MHIELINTGSELLLGRVLNTHQQWICRKLADMGRTVTRQWCVADNGQEIQDAVLEALTRADVVITTGGLGPTSDDLTRDLIAKLLGRHLVVNSAVLDNIEAYFRRRGRPLPESAKAQALVPTGARILPNRFGTAPGLAMEVEPNRFRDGGGKSWVILLPGPPREMRPMFEEFVPALLASEFPPVTPMVCRTLRTTGMGESTVEEKVTGPLRGLVEGGLELGYCARPSEVDVRLVGRGDTAEELVTRAEAIVRRCLGEVIYGSEDESLESVVVRQLTKLRRTVALAESCTGGRIADRLTNVPGASKVLICGLVTYSNLAKERFLGVTGEALAEHGAVSRMVAQQMAEGARQRCGTDYALAVTGIAGPDGGTPEKPVGTVFIALSSATGGEIEKHVNAFDRETFKWITSQQALDLLRRAL